MKKILGVVGMAMLMAGVAQASSITGETSDAYVRARGAGAQGSALTVVTTITRARAGNWTTSTGENHAGIFVFQLPDLGAIANPFDTVTLNFSLDLIIGSPTYNADLYGMDARSANTVLAADFYVGDATDDATDATKLQDSILTSSSTTGAVSSVDISSFLNTQYASGANIGKHVFLRLNRDGDTLIHDENTGYIVWMADDVNLEADKPYLNYTVISELVPIDWIGGAGSADWNDTNSWSSVDLPGTTAGDTVQFIGAEDSTSLTSPFTFANAANVNVQDDATVTIAAPLSGVGALTLSGSSGADGGVVVQAEGTVSADSLTVTDLGELSFTLAASGVNPIQVSNGLSIGTSTAQLTVDVSAYTGAATSIELIQYGSVTGSFEPNSIVISGLTPEQEPARIVFDADSMNLELGPVSYEPERVAILALGNLTNAPALYDASNEPTTWEAVSAAAVSSGTAQSIYYDGLDYNGNPTRIFAWVGLPSDLSSPVPAMVLAHGGGGTAFKVWVDKWTARGYAAIAMDLEGRISSATGTKSANANPGPVRDGIYANSVTYPSVALPNHWMYHAVADCVLANSLMRSLPEVNADQVGMMGISWGGVITSTTMGIDTRFMFTIPTYGCGHLYDDYNQYAAALADCELYKQAWDPIIRIHRATMPAMWFSWPQDQHFALDCQAATYLGAPGEHMVTLIPYLGHGHAPAYNAADSYAFANSIVATGAPWCQQQSLALSNGVATVTFTSTKTLNSAWLISTTGTGWTGDLTWNETAVTPVNNGDGSWTVTATLPEGTTAWFFNVLNGALVATSDYQEIIDLILDPASELEMSHPVYTNKTTATVAVAFTAPTNVEISDIRLSGQSHPGAFTNLTAAPMVETNAFPDTFPVWIEFDNTVAGLTNGQSATATLTIVWDELDGSTDQAELTVSAVAWGFSQWPGTRSDFHGFDLYTFATNGLDCKVAVPDVVAEGKPWIWRARFWDHESDPDVALLAAGYHIAYVDVTNLFGSPTGVARFDAFYDFLTVEYGFDTRTVLEGMSRGGLAIYNWAAQNPDKVHCVYADAPVCDFKSWPGGFYDGTGNVTAWAACKSAYGFASDAEALAYGGNPVDNMLPLARAGIPLLHVVGDADTTVPVVENTAILESRYNALGGWIEVIHKPGVGHVHGLPDPTPIIDFILNGMNFIHNLEASAVDETSATLNGLLSLPGPNYEVQVHWGTTDGGTNAGAWDQSAALGSWTTGDTNRVSLAVSSLVADSTYYFTFSATNSGESLWDDALSFSTSNSLISSVIVDGVFSITDADYGSFASATDLINEGSASLAGSPTYSETPGFGPAETDGTVGGSSTDDITFWSNAAAGSSYSITYALNTSTNTLGYDITSLQTIHGWARNSGNQKNQNYTVEVSTVDDAGFSIIATVAYLPFSAESTAGSSKVTVTDADGILASGVDEIRFTYTVPDSGGNSPSPTIREIDVFGVSTKDAAANTPVFEAGLTVSNGYFVMGFTGSIGEHYGLEYIESLTNSVSWQVVAEIDPLGISPHEWVIPATNSSGFYRMRWIP